MKIDIQVQKKEILTNYQYLFDNFGFKESFWVDNFGFRGEGFCLGLEKGNIHLMFIKEAEARHVDILIGNQLAPFDDPDSRGQRFGLKAWLRLVSLIHFFTGEKPYLKAEYETLSRVEFNLKLSQKLKSVFPLILQKFTDEKIIFNWLGEYYAFVLANK